MYRYRRAIYSLAKHDTDGNLYILEEEDDLFKPEHRRTWWPLGISALEFALAGYPSEWVGMRAKPCASESSVFDLYHPQTKAWLKRFYIAGGAAALATYHERLPIPPPLLTGNCTGMEVAWREGRWCKYSSRQMKRLPCSETELKRGRWAAEKPNQQ